MNSTLSASLVTQLAANLNTSAASIVDGGILPGELYDNTTYLSVDVFQFSFDMPSNLTGALLQKVNNSILRLNGTSNNPLTTPSQQDLHANFQFPIYVTNLPYPSAQPFNYFNYYNLSCDPVVKLISKETLLTKIKTFSYYSNWRFKAQMNSLSIFSNGTCQRSLLAVKYYAAVALNDHNAAVGSNASLFQSLFSNQFVKSFNITTSTLFGVFNYPSDISVLLNGNTTVLLKNRLTLYPIMIGEITMYGESESSMIGSKIVTNVVRNGWPKSFTDVNGNGLILPSIYPTSLNPFPILEMKTLSFTMVGNCGSGSSFASNLTNQLAGVLKIGASFFGGVQCDPISSNVTLVQFNISNFDSQANRVNITTTNSTFAQLVNCATLKLTGIDGNPLVISNSGTGVVSTTPNSLCTTNNITTSTTRTSTTTATSSTTTATLSTTIATPSTTTTTTSTTTATPSTTTSLSTTTSSTLSSPATDATVVKIIMIADYDANNDPNPANNLANQVAAALNISASNIEAPSVVAGDLYDDQTKLSANIIQLSFNLLQEDQLGPLRDLVISGALKLDCQPAGSSTGCEIPNNQDLEGNISYDVTGTPEFLTQANDSVNALRFNMACSANVSAEQLSNAFYQQLQVNPNIFYSKFNAAMVADRDAPCADNNAIYLYVFKLTIGLDYNQTITDEFHLKMGQHLIDILNIPRENLVSTSLDSIDLNGTYNGRPIRIFPQAIQFTFNLLEMPASVQSVQIPLAKIVKLYQLGNWSLQVGVGGDALNVPSQNCQGILNLPLVIQTLMVAFIGDYQTIVGRGSVDKFASLVKQQISGKINLPGEYFNNNYQLETDGSGTTVFCMNVSSFSNDSVVDINAANATFYQLLNAGKLNLVNAYNQLLNTSSVDDVVMKTALDLILVGTVESGTRADLSCKLVHQLSDSLNVTVASFTDANVSAGELLDAATNISASVIKFSFNLLSPYSNWKSTIDQLNSSLANLTLTDLNNNLLQVPVRQDLKGNIFHPVPIRPSVDRLKRSNFNISCQLGHFGNYDTNHLVNLLDDQLAKDPDPGNLIINSTNLTLFDSGACVDASSRFVSLEPVKLTVLNDFDQVVASDAGQLVGFMKDQLPNLLNVSRDHILGANASKVDLPGFLNDTPSVSLLQQKLQLSFVKLSMDYDDGVILFRRPLRLPFNGQQLNIPAQFKNGSTMLALENRTVAMLIMYRYDWLLNGNSEQYFLADFENQLSQSKLLNMGVHLYQNRDLIPNNSTTRYYLNVSSYCNESVINIQDLTSQFMVKLATNNLAVKNQNNYPIHILPIGNKMKFIIIPDYDETWMKMWTPVVATIIVILAVISSEIKIRIKAWRKRQWNAAISPSVDHNQPVSQPLSSAVGEMNGIVQFLDELMNGADDPIMCETRSLLCSIAKIRVENGGRALNHSKYYFGVQSAAPRCQNREMVPEKASYVPPV